MIATEIFFSGGGAALVNEPNLLKRFPFKKTMK